MSSIFDERAASVFSKHTAKLAARHDNGNGGLQANTKIGIVIGLICFFGLLASFWYITHRRRRPAVPTEDSRFADETYSRWEENVLRPTNAPTSRVYEGHEQKRRASDSTITTLASHNEFSQRDAYELSRPPQARLATHP